MDSVSAIFWAQHYDGTNAADVLATVQQNTQYTGNTWSIDSQDEIGVVLKETSPMGLTSQWFIAKGTDLVIRPDFAGIWARISPAARAARFRKISDLFLAAADDPAVIAKLSAALRPQFEIGIANIPALLLGASTTVSVPLSGTFSDTNYQVKTQVHAGTQILASLQITNVVKAVSSVSVTVRANGVASLAGVLQVYCFRTN